MAIETNSMLTYEKLTDLELRDILFDREIDIPLTEENKLIRKHAIKLLKKYDAMHAQQKEERRGVRVILNYSGNPNVLKNCCYVNLNGREMRIPYGREVIIPRDILENVIAPAKTIDSDISLNEDRKVVFQKTAVALYPYTFLGYVDDEAEGERIKYEDEK